MPNSLCLLWFKSYNLILILSTFIMIGRKIDVNSVTRTFLWRHAYCRNYFVYQMNMTAIASNTFANKRSILILFKRLNFESFLCVKIYYSLIEYF